MKPVFSLAKKGKKTKKNPSPNADGRKMIFFASKCLNCYFISSKLNLIQCDFPAHWLTSLQVITGYF